MSKKEESFENLLNLAEIERSSKVVKERKYESVEISRVLQGLSKLSRKLEKLEIFYLNRNAGELKLVKNKNI